MVRVERKVAGKLAALICFIVSSGQVVVALCVS